MDGSSYNSLLKKKKALISELHFLQEKIIVNITNRKEKKNCSINNSKSPNETSPILTAKRYKTFKISLEGISIYRYNFLLLSSKPQILYTGILRDLRSIHIVRFMHSTLHSHCRCTYIYKVYLGSIYTICIFGTVRETWILHRCLLKT